MVIKKSKEDIKKIVKYWRKTSEHDFETMNALFGIKRYPESLFFGHIVLEKILKGLVVEKTGEEAPYIHNLTKLSEYAKYDLLKDELDLLDDVNKFNIRARYPEYKMQFYKQCNREYAKNYIDKITKLYQKLCQKQR
ncbi:MAG: HEPN domain-containing protein [bacterium]|nr:HEPN domain-containing protein [bacterium]